MIVVFFQYDENVCKVACHVLKQRNSFSHIQQWLQCSLRQQITSKVSQQFWDYFKTPVDAGKSLEVLKDAFDKLYEEMVVCKMQCQRLSMLENISQTHAANSDMESYILLLLKAIVFNHANENFLNCLNVAYLKAFKAFDNQQKIQTGNTVKRLYLSGF